MTDLAPKTFPLTVTPVAVSGLYVASPVPDVGAVARTTPRAETLCCGTRRSTDEPAPPEDLPVGPSTVGSGRTTTDARAVEEEPASDAVTSNKSVVSAVTTGAENKAEGPFGALLSAHFTAGVTDLHSPADFLTSASVVHSCFQTYAAPSPLPSVVKRTVEATRLPFASTIWSMTEPGPLTLNANAGRRSTDRFEPRPAAILREVPYNEAACKLRVFEDLLVDS